MKDDNKDGRQENKKSNNHYHHKIGKTDSMLDCKKDIDIQWQ
jgi:hypothetical protein